MKKYAYLQITTQHGHICVICCEPKYVKTVYEDAADVLSSVKPITHDEFMEA